MPSSMNICRSDCGLFSSRLRRRPSCFWKTRTPRCARALDLVCVVSSAWLPAVALEIVAGARGTVSQLMDDLRVAVGGDAGDPAPCSSGVTLTRSSAPGMRWPTSLAAPSTTIRVFSNSSRDVLIAGLAVGALSRRPRRKRHQRARAVAPWPPPPGAAASLAMRRRRTPSLRRRARRMPERPTRPPARTSPGRSSRSRHSRASDRFLVLASAAPPPRRDGSASSFATSRPARILQGAPVFAALSDQVDDVCDTSILISFLSSSVDQTNGVLPSRSAAAARSMYSCTGTPSAPVGQAAELLLEPAFAQREVGRRQRQLHELASAPSSTYSSVVRRPVLVRVRIAVEREPAVQIGAAARIVDEHRAHAALHRQASVAVGLRIGDALLALAGRVDVEHRRRVVVVQELHRRA